MSGTGYRLEWTLDLESEVPGIETRDVFSAEELRTLLEHLETATEEPILVELKGPSGQRMTFGLGHPLSVAQFQAHPTDPPYFESVGDLDLASPHAENNHPVFYYQGHYTEVRREALISKRSAVEGAIEFLKTGQRPGNIRWREV